MFLIKQEATGFLILMIGVYILAWIIQDHLFLNWDVSWLIHASMRMLEGGTYTNDFYSPNPPIILYLYVPPIILSKLLAVKVVMPFRIYIFLLSSLSIFVCWVFIRNIFSKQDVFLSHIFLATLSAIFLILPLYEFGQRDHLLIVLSMPYFLAVTLRLQGGSIKFRYVFIAGLLAGFGFATKPQFLITPILIEMYYSFYRRHWFAWVRIESTIIISLVIMQIIVLYVFYQDFVFVVLPYIMRFYYNCLGVSWGALLLNPKALFCCFPILFYVIQCRDNRYRILSTILLLALIGFLFSYFAQRTLLPYHLIPAFSLAILMLVLLFGLFASRSNITKYDYLFVGMFGLFIFTFLLYWFSSIWTIIIFNSSTYFCFLAGMFSVLLYLSQDDKNWLKMFCCVLFVISIGCLSSYMVQHMSWYVHRFSIVTLLMVFLFSLFAVKPSKGLCEQIFTTVLGILIFIFPIYITLEVYSVGLSYKEYVLNKLIAFVRTQAQHQPIYVFSEYGNYGSPLIDYTNAIFAQRFDCLWMGRMLVKQRALLGDNMLRQYIRNNTDTGFFLNMIADDLHIHKPDLVFVDVGEHNTKLNGHPSHFDYLSYFLEDKKFKHEWQSYHYLTTLEGGNVGAYNYKLQVYKRNMV